MYKYKSWKSRICLESSAESREYMLTYFWEMGTCFYWVDGSIYLLGGGGGGGSKSLGDESPHPPGFAPLKFSTDKPLSHTSTIALLFS